MIRVWMLACLAIVAASAATAGAAAKAPSPARHAAPAALSRHPSDHGAAHAPRAVRARIGYAPRAYLAPRASGLTRGRRQGVADLVGDPYSGFGFHPLPLEIQIGAARYRLTHRRPPWLNPVLSAMAADAIRNPCWIPAGQYYRCGVYNPIDGLGTPFFAGYYR
jgi:hypothetical protein